LLVHRRAVALVAVALVAGCGGGSSATYAVASTQICLQHHAVQVSRASRDLRYFWQSAPEGALNAKVAGNPVAIDFEKTGSDADRTKSAYEAGYSGKTVLEKHGNVVVIWRHPPTSAQRTTVKDCLSE
jgi:hypothetical protein